MRMNSEAPKRFRIAGNPYDELMRRKRRPRYSGSVSKVALPPAAAVLIVTSCSVTKRRR